MRYSAQEDCRAGRRALFCPIGHSPDIDEIQRGYIVARGAAADAAAPKVSAGARFVVAPTPPKGTWCIDQHAGYWLFKANSRTTSRFWVCMVIV